MLKNMAIITGSSGGIGKAIAENLLRNGFIVHGIDVCSSKKDLNTKNYTHHIINIRDFSHLSSLIERILSEKTERCTLINCAGIREICSIESLTLSLWEEVFDINVTATFVTSQAFSKKLISQERVGTIINMASVSGFLGEPNRTAYVSSKHAVLGLTKQLAIEYGKYGIRVNAIAPGVIRTSLTEEYFHNHEQMEKIYTGQFIKKYGTPDDIAAAVYFLASEQSDFMTGSTLVIDGGWLAGKRI
ncbi:SDR family NAD(P)-dependent oxidoreductase [Martelella alba]|uniref:SDR family oxidoreductase n=1 Tax=Martelella alba TaxID=2590451 RepID=A0ABY2SPD4_9HYPH|nr:SDR family oxidoreductase [Martelella alba]TKI06518.1 SDR family oxidoreductase [Martelella alba]